MIIQPLPKICLPSGGKTNRCIGMGLSRKGAWDTPEWTHDGNVILQTSMDGDMVLTIFPYRKLWSNMILSPGQIRCWGSYPSQPHYRAINQSTQSRVLPLAASKRRIAAFQALYSELRSPLSHRHYYQPISPALCWRPTHPLVYRSIRISATCIFFSRLLIAQHSAPRGEVVLVSPLRN